MNSLCLAYMTGMSKKFNTKSKRKMFFEAELLFVDQSAFYQLDPDNKEISELIRKKIQEFSEWIELKLNVIELDRHFDLSEEQCKKLVEDNQDKGSCREDSIMILRNRAIVDFCKREEVSKLIAGDNGLRAATNAFDCIIKGRGHQFSNFSNGSTTFFADETLSIQLVRPLRDFLPKEISFYFKSTGLEKFLAERKNIALFNTGRSKGLPGRGNFGNIIESFLGYLHVI